MTVLKYSFADSVLKVKDVSPPPFFSKEEKLCSMEKDGSYTVLDSTDHITFKKIEDPCNRRSGLLNNLKVYKYKRPE